MGYIFSSIFSSLFSSKKVSLLILGLDNAGKTTILYKMHLGEVVTTVPTVGFNVKTVQYENLNFQLWDLGGQTNLRPLWRCYYPGTNAIIFVIDSTDKERIDTVKQELFFTLEEEELKNAPFVILANKQDIKGAMSDVEICDILGLTKIVNRQWAIFKTCAKTGQGLDDAFKWYAINKLRLTGKLNEK